MCDKNTEDLEDLEYFNKIASLYDIIYNNYGKFSENINDEIACKKLRYIFQEYDNKSINSLSLALIFKMI